MKKTLSIFLVLALCLSLFPAALAAEDHVCAEGEWEDHCCDECWEPLSGLCSDGETEDHLCDICWAPLRDLCADADGDEYCDVCWNHMAEYCADTDDDHNCDECWATLSECVDAGHDHLCDTCGTVLWADANVDGVCDGCEAVLTHVTAQYTKVRYYKNGDATLADVAVEVTVQPYIEVGGAPAGTVAVRWCDENGNCYSTDEKALTFGATSAVVEYPSLPVEALDHGTVTFTPYDAGFTPAENGCVAEYDMPTLWVGSDSPYTVNGVTESKLYLLPGTAVTVVLEPGLTESWEWVFEEGYAVPEMTVDGLTTIFHMPGESVNMYAAWRCEVCTDADGDNWCDVCEYYVENSIYVGGVELADGYYLSNEGIVSAAKPEGGYAHFKDGVLTLNGYEYAGTGYHFAGNYATSGDPYEEYILIYADGTLTIHVEADSTLVNIAEEGENVYSVGVYADELTLTGQRLTLSAGGEAIRCETARLENAILGVIADVGIYSDASGIYEENGEFYGDAVSITDSDVTLIGTDGIYAYVGDISVSGSALVITAEASGIYAYDNGVYLDSSEVAILAGDEAVFAYTELVLGEDHTILVPEDGAVAEKTASYDSDDDGVKDSEYTYQTVVDAEGAEATLLSIHYAPPCDDVSDDAWYADAVNYVMDYDLMDPVAQGMFAPKEAATRADFLTTLWNMAGCPVVNYLMMYEDVNQEEPYAEAVRWASAMGIAKGYPDGTFRPAEAISRQEMATFLYRFEQHLGGGFTGMWMFLLNCTDRADVAEWAYEPMCWMTMKGVMQGDGTGALNPKATATRAEMAQIIQNYMELNI